MTILRRTILAALVLAAAPWSSAQAGGYVSVGVGFRVGGPYYYRPYYGYYRPYPYVVVDVPPVVVAPAPAVIQAAPAPTLLQTPPTPVPGPSGALAPNVGTAQAQIEQALSRLNDPDERVRVEAITQLGRLHAVRAIATLSGSLANDRSPAVREASARALGMIGTPNSLPALQQAAQADDNRLVRQSAQVAADTIRASLPR